jgi:hypothetical protein
MRLPPSSGDAFNVILVGAWNPAIFLPEWAKEHLADDKAKDVILAIPMQFGNAPPRLTVDAVNIYPSSGALMMDCVEYNDPTIDACARKLSQISQLLPHTPVNAVGVNFRFWGDLNDSDLLAGLFTFGDAGRVDSAIYGLTGALVKRAFRISDTTTLNLSMDSSSAGLRVEFNFHSDVRRLSEAVNRTSAEQIRMARDQSVQFLHDVYGIDLDD